MTLTVGTQEAVRNLLVDTGAGNALCGFDLILPARDCLVYGRASFRSVTLGGAYFGSFPLYRLRIRIPQLAFDRRLQVVAVPLVPSGFDGLACFPFLRRFTYGNFGNPDQFGLEL